MLLFCYNGIAENHFCFRASLVVEKKGNNRIVVCVFAETTFNRTYMCIRQIDLKYLHIMYMYFECFLFVQKYYYKNVCICLETKKLNFVYKLKIYELITITIN